MGNRIRVAFFHIGTDIFGGGSKMLLRLLRSLDNEFFKPVLLSQTNDPLCKRAREAGVDVEIIPFLGALDTYNRQLLSGLPRAVVPAAFRILQFSWESRAVLQNADVIWCKNLRAILTILPYVFFTRTPAIWNIGLGLKSQGKLKYLNSIALRTVDHVFIESEEQARNIFTSRQYNRHNGKFTIFHKGIDTDKFDPKQFEWVSKEDGFKIGTAASITSRKGIHYLIDSLPEILKKVDDVTLLIAGKVPEGHEEYKKQLEEQVRRHDIEEHVEFLGWVEDMPAFLSTLDIFVLPSRNEGIPGAVREALAMAVPAVATDVGGTSELIVDGENGILVEPENPKAISHSVITLLKNPQKRLSMGRRGRETIKQDFSIEIYIRDYENFLRNIHTGQA